MVAGVLFSFFLLNLSEADFLDWGWRYPFFCAFAVNVVALFSRLRLVATDEFARLLEQGRLEPSPIIPLIRDHWRDLLVGALIPLASFALFHLVTVFPISWITLFTQRSAGEFLMVQCSGAFICAGAVVASGLIADQIGRRLLLLLAAGLIAVFALCSIHRPPDRRGERDRADDLRQCRLRSARPVLWAILRRGDLAGSHSATATPAQP